MTTNKPEAVNQRPLYTAPQPADQQPCPEGIREGAPYDDPAFSALCREHEVYGTAAAAQCAVFWEAGKRAAEQQPVADVAKLQRTLEASFRREEQLEAEVRELKREKFKKFRGEECWIWAGDGSDELETLMCPVVLSPSVLLEIISHAEAAPDVAGLVEALERSVAGFDALSGMASLDSGARNYARLKALELNAVIAAHRKGGEL